MLEIRLDTLRSALELADFDPQPAHARMAPDPRRSRPIDMDGTPPRQAGVLVLAYPEPDDLHLILTRRTERLRGHSGQISFPGGSRDPEDESLTATALRETCEELGICNEPLSILGTLSPVYIPPTHFDVIPTVAYTPSRPALRPNADEVAEVFTIALSALLDDANKQEEYRQFQGVRVRIPYYGLNGHQIWGATAVMLSELEHRLRGVLG